MKLLQAILPCTRNIILRSLRLLPTCNLRECYQAPWQASPCPCYDACSLSTSPLSLHRSICVSSNTQSCRLPSTITCQYKIYWELIDIYPISLPLLEVITQGSLEMCLKITEPKFIPLSFLESAFCVFLSMI